MRISVQAIVLALCVSLAPTTTIADYRKGERAYQQGRFSAAAKEWQNAADSGDALAQFRLARMYEVGEGVIQDYVRAHALYNVAAASGFADAAAGRDRLGEKMTPGQLAEAQALASQMATNNRTENRAKPTTSVPAPALNNVALDQDDRPFKLAGYIKMGAGITEDGSEAECGSNHYMEFTVSDGIAKGRVSIDGSPVPILGTGKTMDGLLALDLKDEKPTNPTGISMKMTGLVREFTGTGTISLDGIYVDDAFGNRLSAECDGEFSLATVGHKDLVAWTQHNGAMVAAKEDNDCQDFAGLQSKGGAAVAGVLAFGILGAAAATAAAEENNEKRQFLYVACLAEKALSIEQRERIQAVRILKTDGTKP